MDELEIGGKRYLSSKRAAKENKYHIDYIGQLIRAGKIDGKKVGRAWYVEEGSLNKYLAQESGVAPVVVAQEPVQVLAPEIIEEPVAAVQEEAAKDVQQISEPEATIAEEARATDILKQEFAVEEIVTDAVAAVEEKGEQKINITIAEKKPEPIRSNLIYVEDTEPLIPVLNTRVRENADFVAMHTKRVVVQEQPQVVTEDEYKEQSAPAEVVHTIKNNRKKSPLVRTALLVTVAIIFLAVAAVGSSMLATSINVQDGKPASVGFSIK